MGVDRVFQTEPEQQPRMRGVALGVEALDAFGVGISVGVMIIGRGDADFAEDQRAIDGVAEPRRQIAAEITRGLERFRPFGVGKGGGARQP